MHFPSPGRSEGLREIKIAAGEVLEAPSVSNFVRARKYSVLGFLPHALYDRLTSLSSFWFVFVVLYEANPLGLDFGPSYWSLALFAVHLLLTLGIDAVALYRCWRGEASVNSQRVKVWRNGRFEEIATDKLRVGECVLITNGMRAPADLALLATSACDGNCYLSPIRTLGESNLETKSAVRETQRMLVNDESPETFNFDRLFVTVSIQQPNSDFLAFAGTIKLRHFPRAVPLKQDNFILRASTLQGEKWILAVVLYTGMETKYWSNLRHPRERPTFIQHILHRWISVSAVLVLAATGTGSLLQYLCSQSSPQPEDFAKFLGLYLGVVPLGLYVAKDLLRIVHAWQSSSSNITVYSNCKVEALGDVGFVLADKTGTVTQNRLELLAVLIGSQMYSKEPIFPCGESQEDSISSYDFVCDTEKVFSFSDLQRQMQLEEKSEELKRFCECVALCNSIIPLPDGTFRGTSVDEEALIEGATELGFSLCERRSDSITILIFEECVFYQVVCIKKFSADVKRMRILVKQEVDPSTAVLYIKGSYSALEHMLNLSPQDRSLLKRRLRLMSCKGLRTMVHCCRVLQGDYLREIESRIRSISSSRSNAEGNMEVLLMELEQNLTFLGVTGVRDHLQTGAAEAVETLRAAGVTTWLLSGEGESDTLACARQLGTLAPNLPVFSLTGLKKTEDCLHRLGKAAADFVQQDVHATEASVILPATEGTNPDRFLPCAYCLSVDGESVQTAVKAEESQRLLLSLLLSASAVCLHTMHPSHKRQIAHLLRAGVKTEASILGIGASVSDIPMLLDTDISVSLRGDKIDAVTNATVSSFSDLPQLILRSGRSSSAQMSRAVLLFLYSQVLLVLGEFAYPFCADFTPVSLVPSEGAFLYGAVFTLLPIISLSILPTRHDKLIELKKTGAVLAWTNLWTRWALAVAQFCVISGIFLAGLWHKGATVVTSDQLSFLYLGTIVKVVCMQCCAESPRLSGAAVQVFAIGCFYWYYCWSEDGRATVASVYQSPNLLLTMAGAVTLCAVVSFAYTSGRVLQDLGHFLSSKVVPMSLRRSEFKLSCKSLLCAYNPRAFEPFKVPADRFSQQAGRGRFLNPQTERRFQLAFLRANSGLYWVLAFFVFVQAAVPFAIEVSTHDIRSVRASLKCTALTAVCLVIAAFAVGKVMQWLAQCFALVLVVAIFVLNLLLGTLNSSVYFYVTVCLLLFLREKWLPNCVIASVASVLLIGSECAALISGNQNLEDVLSAAGSVTVQLATLSLCIVISLRQATLVREQFALIEATKDKIEQSDTVLGYLLPSFVCNHVKDGLTYIAEDQGDVSVIFIDICDFDLISNCYSPSELTALLDEIFQRIDELCASLQVAKIETVGKTYLACAGLKDFEFEEMGGVSTVSHARRAIDLAFAVLRNFKSMKLINERPLAFKIGINSGPVIAGVAGYHKPQFVLVGDTVNTASRMASSLDAPNSIQISSSTQALLADRNEYECVPRLLQVKGKGLMTTYTVTSSGRLQAEAFSRQTTMRSVRGRRSSLLDESRLRNVNDACCESNLWKLSEEEKEFRREQRQGADSMLRLALAQYSAGFFCLFFLKSLCEAITENAESCTATVGYVILAASGAAAMLFLKDLSQRSCFPWVLGGLYAAGSVLMGLDTDGRGVIAGSFVSLVVGHLLVLVHFASGMLARPATVITLLVLAPHLAQAHGRADLERNFFYLLFALQCCAFHYLTEGNQRTFHTTAKRARLEIEKTEQLLTHMIPIHAYEGLQKGDWSTDRLSNVSILFADISGFTFWASMHSPSEVIEKLRTIFTAFDKICVKRDVYKVCTIGDCYVALSSTSNSDRRNAGEECVRMVKFAVDMVDAIEEICRQDGEQLKMRIGIHVGEVVAGITGSHIVRYDIYGPDVTVANKMESSGTVGKVNVSARAKELLEKTSGGEFKFEFNKKVEVPEIDRSTESFFVSLRNAAMRRSISTLFAEKLEAKI